MELVNMDQIGDSENRNCFRGVMVDESVVASISLHHKRYRCESEPEIRAPIRTARGVWVGDVSFVVDQIPSSTLCEVRRLYSQPMRSRVCANFLPIFLVKRANPLVRGLPYLPERIEKRHKSISLGRITTQTNTLPNQ